MFTEFFKSSFNDANKDMAFTNLVTNTLAKPKYNDDKLTEITGMNFESKFNKDFIPSMIYTFQYETKKKDKINKVSFIDYVPLVLCFTSDTKYITGLNFNLIPNSTRAELLDMIYNAYKNFYVDKLSKAVKDNTPIVNEEFASFLINEHTRTEFLKIVSEKLKYNINKTYRKYDKTKIKNARLIEFDMWKYIPMLVFDDAVRGAVLVSIQKAIINSTK